MRLLFGFLFVFMSLLSFAQNSFQFYVGTFTSEGGEGIYLCSFDELSGSINLEKTFKAIDNPSFLKISNNKKYLYAVSRTEPEIEKSGGFAVAYKIGDNGDLYFLNKQISNGQGPCHIDVSPDGKFVAIATYAGGTTSLYPLKQNGEIGKCSTIIKNSGSGPHKPNQDRPHAHSIKFSPFGNTVFSADLGTDRLNIFHLENGELKTYGQEFVKMEPGAGPRHFTFNTGQKIIYVINELNSTVTTLQKSNGEWKVIQNISALPDGFEGESYCADIHLSNDGRFLYGSNRGHNSIAVFTVGESGLLTLKTTVPVRGDWPRNFALTPDGNFMLVANQRSGNITVFRIDKTTGVPEFTGNEIKIPAPVCVEFL